MRLILDTNILPDRSPLALGAPAKLLDAWERETFTLVACDALIAELRDVAGRPFFRARLRASAELRLILHRDEGNRGRHFARHRCDHGVIPVCQRGRNLDGDLI
jgi:predicted nucleic acid-binding protein